MFSLFLPPEEVPESEQTIRTILSFLFRSVCASFFSYQCFDFLFSPLWMHGYVWSLNQPNDYNLNRKSAGTINSLQQVVSSIPERMVLSTVLVLVTWIVLWMAGFRGHRRSVWYLLTLSAYLGFATGIIRCLQMKQRLFSCLHEGFYAYFVTFFNGLFLTIQFERLPNTSQKLKEEIEKTTITTTETAKLKATMEKKLTSNLESNDAFKLRSRKTST